MSPKLLCDNNKLIIPYKDLIDYGVVLVSCQKDSCYAKLGQKPIWRVKNND
jgi:hypothetical protein